MRSWIFLLQCRDQKGIVAKVSDCIVRLSGNIIILDQYSTDPQGGYFFMRVEFMTEEKLHDKDSLSSEFDSAVRQFNGTSALHAKEEVLRMGIVVSRPDHCLFELLYLWRTGELSVTIPFVISNFQGHRELVERFGVPFHFLAADKSNRKEEELLALVKSSADFLVLARYMLILTGDFLARFGKDIINIHHGFLPSFKGAHPYRQALTEGVKVIGATAHFVNENLDAGPIIAQAVEPVSHKDDLASLVRKGKNSEKRALSYALNAYLDRRIFRFQNKTVVF